LHSRSELPVRNALVTIDEDRERALEVTVITAWQSSLSHDASGDGETARGR